jgi:predicted AAA+ superfamily ATPase
MTLTDAQRQTLLTELREMGRASSAELESREQFQRAFYPVAEHLRVFEPNVNLIIGYHGAGKSMLFKAAVEQLLSVETIRTLLGRDLFLHTLAD